MPDHIDHRPGHVITGWTLLTDEGADTAAVYFRCTDLGSVPTDALVQVHAEDRAVPPLDTCGHQHLG